jgi:hypothetical protein
MITGASKGDASLDLNLRRMSETALSLAIAIISLGIRRPATLPASQKSRLENSGFFIG